MATMRDSTKAPGTTDIFKALADPTRRQILQDLKHGELAAGEIAAKFPISGPSISRHLFRAEGRRAGHRAARLEPHPLFARRRSPRALGGAVPLHRVSRADRAARAPQPQGRQSSDGRSSTIDSTQLLPRPCYRAAFDRSWSTAARSPASACFGSARCDPRCSIGQGARLEPAGRPRAMDSACRVCGSPPTAGEWMPARCSRCSPASSTRFPRGRRG